MVGQRAQTVHDIVEGPVGRGALVEIVVQSLTPQVEEVVEIVGAQICCAALGAVHVLRRSVRFDSERIKSAARCVLQGHIHPVEQLCRLVHRSTSLYSRHHIAFGRLRLLEQHRQNCRIFWTTQFLSVIPFESAGWV